MEDRLAQVAVFPLNFKWLCHERDARASGGIGLRPIIVGSVSS